MMEKLTVDAEGRIIIPSEVIQKRGLRPGDEITLIQSDEGLLVYQGGIDAKNFGMVEQTRRQAAPARRR